MKIKIEKNIIQFVSFFMFSGYYAGLSVFFATGLQSLSRFYTIPLRVFLSIVILYFISHKIHVLRKNKFLNLLCLLFTSLYIFKVLYSANIDAKLSRSWGEYIFYFLSFTTLPFLFYSAVDLVKYKQQIIKSMIIAGLCLGLLNIYIFKDVLLSGGIGRLSNLTAVTGEEVISPLALAYSGAITIVLCLYKLIFEKMKSKEKLLIYSSMLISFVLFFLGATRGALVAVFLSLIIILYFGDAKKRFMFLTLILFASPVVIAVLNFTGSSLFKRTSNSIKDGDTSGREVLWQDAYKEFINYPILGGRIEVSGIYPHNIFLEILMATGVIGFILFLLIMISSLYKGIFQIRKENVYLFPLLIFICGFSQHLVTGSLWGAITLFSSMGMLNSQINNGK